MSTIFELTMDDLQGVPRKVSIKKFNCELFITLIHSFLLSLDLVDL